MRKKHLSSKMIINGILLVICLIWIIPTLGLFISSFRMPDDIKQSGWWNVFPHREWKQVETVVLPAGTNLKGPLVIEGAATTDRKLRQGIELENGQRAKWENRRELSVAVLEKRWTVSGISHWTII